MNSNNIYELVTFQLFSFQSKYSIVSILAQLSNSQGLLKLLTLFFLRATYATQACFWKTCDNSHMLIIKIVKLSLKRSNSLERRNLICLY